MSDSRTEKYFVLRQRSLVAQAGLLLSMEMSLALTPDPPATTSRVLGLQGYVPLLLV